MFVFRLPVCLSVLFVLVSVSGAWPQDAAKPSAAGDGSMVDSLEYDLEIGLHKRLVDTRRTPGVQLAPFESDGCSGGLSAGWALISSLFPALAERHGDHPPWERCCFEHDRLYHAGGPRNADADASFAARRAADERLRQCVIDVGAQRAPALMAEYGLGRDRVSWLYRRIAQAMYNSVRLGGAPCTGLSWRWGFGWPSCNKAP